MYNEHGTRRDTNTFHRTNRNRRIALHAVSRGDKTSGERMVGKNCGKQRHVADGQHSRHEISRFWKRTMRSGDQTKKTPWTDRADGDLRVYSKLITTGAPYCVQQLGIREYATPIHSRLRLRGRGRFNEIDKCPPPFPPLNYYVFVFELNHHQYLSIRGSNNVVRWAVMFVCIFKQSID